MITQKRKGPYPGWHDFVAGAAAGAGARIMTHPLDLIRIRRQLGGNNKTATTFVHDMWLVVQNEGGIRGLFRGNLAAINLWVSYTGVQFYAYASSKHYFQETFFSHENQQTLVAFCAGASAGVAATVTTYPLDLCRTIFAAKGADIEPPPPQVQQTTKSVSPTPAQQQSASFRAPKSTWEFATQLYRNRGWRGFYAGCTPTVLQIIPYMGSSFAIYDSLTRGDRDIGLSAYAGSIAGAVSKTLVYPMDTVKKRLQAQTFYDTHGYYVSIVDCVTTIYRREGVWAFYNGLVPSVLKTALAAGLSFMFFRSVKNLLESIHDRPFTKADPPTRRSLTSRMTTGN